MSFYGKARPINWWVLVCMCGMLEAWGQLVISPKPFGMWWRHGNGWLEARNHMDAIRVLPLRAHTY
uniref:Uncharacterized protein n=1 Tax=Arundo donax TaxID=35708 RepID=A0A0A9BH20_ARUDO